MTDAMLTEPRGPNDLVPPDTHEPLAYKPRRSHKRAPLQSAPVRLLFAEDRQRTVADTLQGIIFKGGILSLLTFTIYRFWMKTDQRRLIWRETRLDGDGFEYTGTPLELLIGSMIAIVILAVWFGIANLGLSFLHLAAWQNYDLTVLVFPIIVSPLVAFAIYRARRYKLLRTKWRGIRFGMDGSAIKYAVLWILWTLVQVVSLGFLTFHPPERALRHLTAHWMLPWITGITLTGLVVWGFHTVGGFSDGFFAALDAQAEETGEDALALKIQALIGLAVVPALLVYPFYSSRRLHSAYFESHLTWGTTFKPFAAYCGYWLLLIIPISIALGLVMIMTNSIANMIEGTSPGSITEGLQVGSYSSLGAQIAFYAGLYFFYGGMVLFSLWLAGLIHFRRLHTYICRGTVVHNLISVNQVKQRVRDDQAESEGFAEIGTGALGIFGRAGRLAQWDFETLRRVSGTSRETEMIEVAPFFDSDERLRLDDRGAVKALRSAHPHVDKRPPANRPAIMRALGWTGTAVGALAFIIFVAIPALAPQIAAMIPVERQISLGEQVETLISDVGLVGEACTTPEGSAALDKMTAKLTEGLELRIPVRVSVVNSPNALNLLTKSLVSSAMKSDMFKCNIH